MSGTVMVTYVHPLPRHWSEAADITALEIIKQVAVHASSTMCM